MTMVGTLLAFLVTDVDAEFARLSAAGRVTLGASRASPVAITLIAVSRSAGGVSLSRKPLAPARSAP
jgi:hypothetical protein